MVAPGRLGLKGDPAKSDAYTDILRRAGRDSIAVETELRPPEENKKLAFQSFGADFVEVKIDPLLPRPQVTRVVSVINGGRIVNAKTARSQIIGGIVMGIGMALSEETAYDPHTGLPATRNLADYHVPTNADIPQIDVTLWASRISPSTRSAAAASARSGSRASPLPWPTQFITPPARASALSRLRRTS